jgi:glyoxylase-like metal-dependent hydrolase (beta-lactamase superfamily II)
MNAIRQLALFAAVLTIFAQDAGDAQNIASPSMTLVEATDDVYVMQHPAGSSNSAFVVTPEGVVVFDADIRTADQVLAAIRRITDKKVRLMIISHPAGDHATGAWHFREDDPLIIASRRQASELSGVEMDEFTARKASNEPDFAAYRNAELIVPDIVFDKALTLKLGGLTFEITEEGAAHSHSDVTLYIPEKRVFAVGDLFKSEMHTGPGDTVYDSFGAAKEWMAIISRILERPIRVDTFIPGHGPVHVARGRADLEELLRYFSAMRGEVSRYIAEGKSEAELLATFKTPAEFAQYGRVDTVERFLPLYYRQLIAEGAGR